MICDQLRDALVNAYIATRTPARKGSADWSRVRRSLECEIFAKALPTILATPTALDPATIEHCLACQPTTAENPNESAYERGRFDGIMAFAKAIRASVETRP